jgi:hypothetical protein
MTTTNNIITLGQDEGFQAFYKGGTFWLQEASEFMRTTKHVMSACGHDGRLLTANARKRGNELQLPVRPGDFIFDGEYNRATKNLKAHLYRIVGIDIMLNAGGEPNGFATLRVLEVSGVNGNFGERTTDWSRPNPDYLDQFMGAAMCALI